MPAAHEGRSVPCSPALWRLPDLLRAMAKTVYGRVRSIFRIATQEKRGIDAYIQAQEGLSASPCDDVFLEPVCSGAQWRHPLLWSDDGPEDQGFGVWFYPAPPAFCIGANGKSLSIATNFDSFGPPLQPCLLLVVFVRLALPTIRV